MKGRIDVVFIPVDGSALRLVRNVRNDNRALTAALVGEDVLEHARKLDPTNVWYLESVRVRGPEPSTIRYLLVDEDGMRRGMARNVTCSEQIYPGDIWGDALLVRGEYHAEEWESADESDLAWVKGLSRG